MKKKYDMVATIGKYEDQGQTKYRTMKVGVVFEDDKGYLSAKIDALPTAGTEWTGWVKFFEPKIREEHFEAAKKAVAETQDDGFGDSSIPF